MTEQTSKLQRVLDDTQSNAKKKAGLQAAVVFSDGTMWNATAGYASDKQCPMTLDHHLYIGSMTKLFTAALVMKQMEQGNLALDDTLDKWVALPYARNVTVKMLLNHTSGIPNYTEDVWFLARYLGLPAKRWRPDVLEQTSYRLGVRRLAVDGEVFVGHTGSIPGYSGIVMHSEQRRYTIAILSNLSIIEQAQLLSQIRTVVNGESCAAYCARSVRLCAQRSM